VDPITLLFIRFTIASVIMAAIMAVRREPLPRGPSLGWLAALGGVGYVGQSFCYFTALTLASAGLVSLLLYLYPILVAVASMVFLKEKLTPAKGIALGLALAGAALTIGFGGRGTPAGIALGVAAAVIYSAYIMAGSRVMKKVSALQSSTVVIASAAVVYGVVTAIRGASWPQTAGGWAAAAAVAVVSTVIAISGFFLGLERIGPTNASTLSTVEPAITVCLAAVFLGESFPPLAIAGGALILTAVIVLARGEMKKRQGAEAAVSGE
jgi:drug/metabolite transporter (DMT)-like permease